MPEEVSLNIKLRKKRTIVERRSKGLLLVAEDRLTGEDFTVRRILLDVTNAGKDDGVPTSIMRELTNLKSIDHPNVAKIESVRIINTQV